MGFSQGNASLTTPTRSFMLDKHETLKAFCIICHGFPHHLGTPSEINIQYPSQSWTHLTCRRVQLEGHMRIQVHVLEEHRNRLDWNEAIASSGIPFYLPQQHCMLHRPCFQCQLPANVGDVNLVICLSCLWGPLNFLFFGHLKMRWLVSHGLVMDLVTPELCVQRRCFTFGNNHLAKSGHARVHQDKVISRCEFPHDCRARQFNIWFF